MYYVCSTLNILIIDYLIGWLFQVIPVSGMRFVYYKPIVFAVASSMLPRFG